MFGADSANRRNRRPGWIRRGLQGLGIYVGIVFLVAAFLLINLSILMVHHVLAGQRAVRYAPFNGGTQSEIHNEGLQVILPWDRLFVYDIRVQEVHDTVIVLTSNGLPLTVTYSVRYHPDTESLPTLHQVYGPNYLETLLKPQVVGSLRQVLGNYRPEEIYSVSEGALTDEIYLALTADLANRFVFVEEFLLTGLRLTEELEGAINDKLIAEQNALAYEFILEGEEREAERKRIEAAGISDFREISGVEDILRWRGIQATEALAKSENSKIIVIGPGGGDLPVILNTNQ